METNFRNTNLDNIGGAFLPEQKKALAMVFGWMFVGMLVTSLTSLSFSFIPNLLDTLIKAGDDGYYHKTMLGHIITFAPLIILIGMGVGYKKLSYIGIASLFLFFSAVLGISFSFIFISYELGSIISVFVSTTLLFAIMATVGYFTKTDLTKMGSILTIGAFGVIGASVVNYFMGFEKVGFIISVIGVVVFTGLIAFHMQKIKNDLMIDDGTDSYKKRAVAGALSLYVDFINLFISLLNIFGDRK